MSELTKLEKRLRLFGTFIVAGLLLEMFSLMWVHPLAFVLFVVVGCGCLFIGMVGYLYSIVSIPIEREASDAK